MVIHRHFPGLGPRFRPTLAPSHFWRTLLTWACNGLFFRSFGLSDEPRAKWGSSG